MYYTTKKTQKKIANLGYGWAMHLVKISANKGVLNVYLITQNSKIILALSNATWYKIFSPSGDDLTGNISPGQLIKYFGVSRNGNFIGVTFEKVPLSFAKKIIPESVFKKIVDFPSYKGSYMY